MLHLFKKSYFTLAAVLMAAPFFAMTSEAATVTSAMPVSATIPTTCTAVAGTSLVFGTLASSLSVATTNATGTITVNCSNGGSYTVIVNTGGNVGTAGQLRMIQSTAGTYMLYNISAVSSGGAAFPTATTGATTLYGNGANQTITVYGQIPTQTVTNVGSYSDSLTFTVTY